MFQMKTGAGRLGVMAAMLMIATGCVIEVDFTGDEVAVEGSWTVEGAVPSVATCGEIDDVELFVYDEFADDFVSALRANCATGSVTTGNILRAGTYRLQWVAYDAAGFEIQRSVFTTARANIGETIVSAVDFDFVAGMVGDEVAVAGDWTVDGAVPSLATCGDITEIELLVFDEFDATSLTAFTSDCAAGSFTTDPILFAGTYRLQWVATDAAGVELQRSDFVVASAGVGETIVSSVDFDFFSTGTPDVTLSGEWLINGFAADVASCNAAGIDTVRLEVANDPAGSDVEIQFDFDCERGSFDARSDAPEVVLPSGFMFYTRYVALDAGGASVGATDFLELDTAVVTHAITATPDFTVIVENTLRVNFSWEDGLGTGTFVSCADVNAPSTMGFTLTDSLGGEAASQFGIACEDALDFGPPLDADMYSLDIIGDADDGTKWSLLCDGLVVEAGLEEYDCLVVVVP